MKIAVKHASSWPLAWLIFDVSQNTRLAIVSLKQNYLVAPLVCMAGFVCFYFYWKSQPQSPRYSESRSVDAYAKRDGKKEAEAMWASEKLVLIESGPKVGWDAERREIALSKYGVDLRRLDDSTTEAAAMYIDSFNRVMKSKVLARHGRGFFDGLHQEAISLHETRSRK